MSIRDSDRLTFVRSQRSRKSANAQNRGKSDGCDGCQNCGPHTGGGGTTISYHILRVVVPYHYHTSFILLRPALVRYHTILYHTIAYILIEQTGSHSASNICVDEKALGVTISHVVLRPENDSIHCHRWRGPDICHQSFPSLAAACCSSDLSCRQSTSHRKSRHRANVVRRRPETLPNYHTHLLRQRQATHWACVHFHW